MRNGAAQLDSRADTTSAVAQVDEVSRLRGTARGGAVARGAGRGPPDGGCGQLDLCGVVG